MKKMIALACGSVAVLGLLAGCTSVDSTQKFNQVKLTELNGGKAVCQTLVEIPCYTFWGLPIIGGSAAGNGKMAIFQNNTDTESVMHLLTREILSKNGTRVINVQTSVFEMPVMLGLFTKRVMQASGTGVSFRQEMVKRAGQEFDQVPNY